VLVFEGLEVLEGGGASKALWGVFVAERRLAWQRPMARLKAPFVEMNA
jgi:hypothetical protein